MALSLSRKKVEMKHEIQAPDALPQEVTPVPTVQEDIWTLQAVRIFWRMKDTIARTDTKSPDLPARNVVDMPNTLLRVEYIRGLLRK